jgi:UDP-N-acetylglucosamine:LPS N-acetylglucosamine transferase
VKRVLIISADVAGGHDAASAALRARILARYPGATVTSTNGLAALGSITHRVVRDGYQRQLRHAQWSYRLLFHACDSRLLSSILWRLLPLVFGARMLRHVRQSNPDLVVSTYPLCTGVLGGLRSRGSLDARLIALVTDIHPHRMWFAPGVDQHLVCAPGDISRTTRAMPWACVSAVRPPTNERFAARPGVREAARDALELPNGARVVVVTGGAWGVGSMQRIVSALDRPEQIVVVACGHNANLQRELAQTRWSGEVRPIGFTDRMHDYMHAADAVVATGAGLTVFEAIAARVAVVMASPLPGHGIRSAKALQRDGLAAYSTRLAGLPAAVDRTLHTHGDGAYLAARDALLSFPCAAEYVTTPVLIPPTHTLRPSGRLRRTSRTLTRVAVPALVAALMMFALRTPAGGLHEDLVRADRVVDRTTSKARMEIRELPAKVARVRHPH